MLEQRAPSLNSTATVGPLMMRGYCQEMLWESEDVSIYCREDCKFGWNHVLLVHDTVCGVELDVRRQSVEFGWS